VAAVHAKLFVFIDVALTDVNFEVVANKLVVVELVEFIFDAVKLLIVTGVANVVVF